LITFIEIPFVLGQ